MLTVLFEPVGQHIIVVASFVVILLHSSKRVVRLSVMRIKLKGGVVISNYFGSSVSFGRIFDAKEQGGVQ